MTLFNGMFSCHQSNHQRPELLTFCAWIPLTKGWTRGKCVHVITSSCDFEAMLVKPMTSPDGSQTTALSIRRNYLEWNSTWYVNCRVNRQPTLVIGLADFMNIHHSHCQSLVSAIISCEVYQFWFTSSIMQCWLDKESGAISITLFFQEISVTHFLWEILS